MKPTRFLPAATLMLLGAGATVMLVSGCQSSAGGESRRASAANGDDSSGKPSKGGAQLWAENCMLCHNVRSPSAYSDAEWDVVMQHMRVRGYLSAADTEAITKFLKSAN